MFCTPFLENLWSRLFSSKSEPPSRISAPPVENSIPSTQMHEQPDLPKQVNAVASICRSCQSGPFSDEGFTKAISDFHNADTGYCYTTTWRDVSRSVREESCNWCRLLSQAKDGLPASKFPRSADESVEVRVQITINLQQDWIDVTNTTKAYLNGYPAATYFIYADEDDPAAKEIGTGNHIRQEDPYVDYLKVLDCIEECGHHEHCPGMAETYLPTRVIDCSDPSKPRLVDTRRQAKAHYCTLSYVWGGEQHQKTTTTNVDTYLREGINIPLPRTIADAIIVTHKLGIRYLWVDALCIIQDSAEDKVKELADMAHIYRDSYVTISVLSAYRADEGFLHDEHPVLELPFHTADGPLGHMLLKYSIPRQSRALGYKHQTVEMHSPLDTRGWCFQESILSPRRLCFQPPYVHYKCRSWSEELTRESGFESIQPPYQVDDHTLFPVIKAKENANPAEVERDQLYDLWCSMLSEYTNRQISVPTDKLIAFSSVAEEFQSRLQDNYIAGLWQRTLIDGLLWNIFRAPDEVLPSRPLEYRAPTWSWASVDGMVLPYQQHMLESPSTDYEAEVLACEVTPKSRIHPLGEIAEAKLTMNAKIQPLMPNGQKCTFTEKKGVSYIDSDGLTHVSLGGAWIPPLGNSLEASQAPAMNSLSDEERGTERIPIRFDCLEGTAQDREMDFYIIILRAGRRWGNHEGYRDESWMRGLLVQRIDGQLEQYRRVAMLDLWQWKWPDWVEATPSKTVTLV